RRTALGRPELPVGADLPRLVPHVRRWPGGALLPPRVVTLDEERRRRLGWDAVMLAPEPALPPPLHLAESRRRRFEGHIREGMLPRPHEEALRGPDSRVITHCGLGVEVAPPSDVERGRLDPVHRDDARRPDLIPIRVVPPGEEPGDVRLAVAGPHALP